MHRTKQAPYRQTFGRVLLVIALAMLGQFVLLPAAADAATALTVTTTADTPAAGGACGSTGITTPAVPLSLREATCLANNLGGTVTISVPSGTYLLSNGQLKPGLASGQDISYVGAGAASTIVNAQGLSRVIDVDDPIVGGVVMTISGMTITGGADSTFGGAGIIAGSGNELDGDTLTLSNVTVTGNNANAAGPAVTNKPGGGVQFLGGKLTISNSTISNNSSQSSQGGGVVYSSNGGGVAPEGLTITNTVFSGNTMTNTSAGTAVSNGGALALRGGASTPFNISNSVFRNNVVTATSGPAIGAAIWQQSGVLSVTESSFTGNSASGGAGTPTGGAIGLNGGSATLNYDRFVGNTATSGQAVGTQNAATANATDSWWGCNAGPGNAGCDSVSGTVTAAPRLVLTASASPATVIGPNGTSTVTGSLVTDSDSANVGTTNLDAFAALPVSFSDPPGDATVTLTGGPHNAGFSAGVASVDYHSNTTVGSDPVNVTFDNATVTAAINVNQAPVFTSANNTNFNIGSAGSFTVTTTGFPAPPITTASSLPSGVTLTDNGNGTATLGGTPAAGSGGTYPINLVANNGVAPNATQTFTLTIGAPPAFTSPATATFTTGSGATFNITTSGTPPVTAITQTAGALPSGLTFTASGSTATIVGTPAVGTGGTYPITLQAVNGVTPNAIQTLTVRVNQAPVITTNPSSQTVNPGSSVSFTAAASGVPLPSVQWQRNTGAGYVNIPGATSTTYTFTATGADSANLYHAVFTNSVSSATSAFATLTVGSAPTISSANTTTFTVGAAGSFTISTSGFPSPAIIVDASTPLPAWLTLTDHADSTATLSGTPPAGSGGLVQFQLDAQNGFSPSDTQAFTLNVNSAPVITSADHATFTVAQPGVFQVTTTPGHPAATGFSITPALPAGLALTDNGDGTADLAGTPPAGFGGVHTYSVSANATGGTTAPTTQTFTLTVNESPTISSADHATFAVGAAGSFTVTTTGGFPTPAALAIDQADLPAGVTFDDNGDGTATLHGTPVFGTGGSYALTITADAGATTEPATQDFTLTVHEPPVFTSADQATFALGSSSSFTITTAGGDPADPTITAPAGDLPPGMTLHDLGDGTATVDGTPTAGGAYQFVITASNGVLPNATQTFTATVTEAPSISSTNHATFAVGSAGSFTVTTNPGTPTATQVRQSGADLAALGLTFTPDDATGTAVLAGTPVEGSGGTHVFTVSATNAAGFTLQTFTLTITELPAFTSADHTTFAVGTPGSFEVTTSPGFPTATTITAVVHGSGDPLPGWLTLTDHGDGTATLAGTPPPGGGIGDLALTASNTAGDVTQVFALTVTEPPAFSSADHATFDVGAAGNFAVTTVAGFPPGTTITGPTSAELPAGVTFTAGTDGTATLAGTPAAGTGGTYEFEIVAGNTAGQVTQHFTLTVDELPTLTSADHATFAVGTAGSFTVTTAPGFPAATALDEVSGIRPAWLSFTDNGDGTATLAGTPPAGSGGQLALNITATNPTGTTTQAFTLTIGEAPAFSSADHATFDVGAAATFAVTTVAGFPPGTSITGPAPADLPDGVTFIAHAEGTATLAGTPTAGTGGTYAFDIVAGNSAGQVTQHFTLTVDELPTLTSADHATFAVGSAGTFTVTTTPGFPTATALAEVSGHRPAWLSFTDNGDGTATLAGTPPTVSGGQLALSVTATNTTGTSTQAFTLTIGETPSLTSAEHVTFAVGALDTFAVTTAAGFPTATTITGPTSADLPAGVTFTAHANGTATLTGTAAAGTGGTYDFDIVASNDSGFSTQHFTLTVTELPAVTSAEHATFTVGAAGTFTVTTAPGFPTATALAEVSGHRPAWLSFTDNGDGTATLAGTPPAGSGGQLALSFTATNAAGATTSAFTLDVNEAPTITSADNATFDSGTAGSFTVTTAAGVPTPALSIDTEDVLPAGISFDDNGDGTATLSGTASVGGSYPLQITASNGVTADATQDFTLTVNGPPSFTSADSTTFTAGVRSSFAITVRDGVPAGYTVTESGPLPSGITFTAVLVEPAGVRAAALGEQEASLSGIAAATSVGSYPITLTASNGVDPATTQDFTLVIKAAAAVLLPSTPPTSSGALVGVPTSVLTGGSLRISGANCAAGAPVTVGSYSPRVVLATGTANSAGKFSIVVKVPTTVGRHEIVASCYGVDGVARFLTAVTVVKAAAVTPTAPTTPPAPVPPTTPISLGGGSGGSGGLANTGPGTDPRGVAGYAVIFLLGGLSLLVAGRRRRAAHR